MSDLELIPPAKHYIDTGFWHITEQDAAKLARNSPHGKLPRPGYMIDVRLPDGRSAILQRTVVSGRTWCLERQEVWAFYAVGAHDKTQTDILAMTTHDH